MLRRVDLNELRNNSMYKTRRYSLQREASSELKRSMSDPELPHPCLREDNANNNADSSNKEGSNNVDTKSETIINNGNNANPASGSESTPESASSPTLMSRSISSNMVLKSSSAGLHLRPISLGMRVPPDISDLDAPSTLKPAENSNATQNSVDLAAAGEQEGVKKKRSKGFMSGISSSKLRGKFEKITAASKLWREDKEKKEIRRSGELGGSNYISPRSSDNQPASPDGSPPVLAQSEMVRNRLSLPPSPQSSVRYLYQTPPGESSALSQAASLNNSSDRITPLPRGSSDDIFEAEEPVRRGKKLENFFGAAPEMEEQGKRGKMLENAAGAATPEAPEEPVRKGKKIEKFFGDVPTNVYDRNAALEDDDEETVDIQEDGVIYNPRKKKGGLPIIKGATMQKLVERLTHHSESDPNFLHQFLLTYRTFTTPQGLLDLLKARLQALEEKEKENAEGNAKYKQVTRLRLFNMLKSWLQHHWVDFQGNSELTGEIMKFSELISRDDMNMAAKNTLVRIVTKNSEGEKEKTLVFNSPPPKSYIPAAKDKLSLADIHPEEFARQITLLEYNLYKAIKPWELLTHTQGKKSSNIVAMINQFNDLNKWVQSEILRAGETPKQRAVTFVKLLEICEHLRSLNNYNALMEIISGLNASPIFRLKLTWNALGSKHVESFNELNTLMSGNGAYKCLRNTLHTIKPPCIPYMGMYLTDLTFINDGNPQYLENGYINFDKCRRFSNVIQEIVQYQQTPYCLKNVDEIQQYLKTMDFERDENKIYQLSLQLEERGSVRM